MIKNISILISGKIHNYGRGGAGDGEASPRNRKFVYKNWSYFSALYKMTKVVENPIENCSKINFPLRFSLVNLKIFSKIKSSLDFKPIPSKIGLYLS